MKRALFLISTLFIVHIVTAYMIEGAKIYLLEYLRNYKTPDWERVDEWYLALPNLLVVSWLYYLLLFKGWFRKKQWLSPLWVVLIAMVPLYLSVCTREYGLSYWNHPWINTRTFWLYQLPVFVLTAYIGLWLYRRLHHRFFRDINTPQNPVNSLKAT